MVADTSPAPSPGAVRQRRYRDRQRNGTMRVSLLVSSRAAEGLIARGWLAAADRTNRAAVAHAQAAVLNAASAAGLELAE